MTVRSSLLITAVAGVSLFAAPAAYAHDNTITASSQCNQDKAGTWTAYFVATNDFKLSEVVTFTFDDGSPAQSGPLGPFMSGQVTVVEAGAVASVTASETGTWSDGHVSPPHSATATNPGDCAPPPPPPPPPPPVRHHHHHHHHAHHAHGIGTPQTITVPAANELPHTGAPVWAIILAGLGLTGGGLVLRRRLP